MTGLQISNRVSPSRIDKWIAFGVFTPVFLFYLWTGLTSQAGGAEESRGYYNLLTDGFLAGRLSLLVTPSPQLLALQDPYDPDLNAPYRLHDAALYKGKYYLYYGPTPVLILFGPFKLLTGRHLSEGTAAALFASAGFLFTLLLLLLYYKHFCDQLPTYLVYAAGLGLAFCNAVPFLLRRPLHYEVAISCGFALVFASLYCFATVALLGFWSRWRLIVGSLLLGLAVGARFPVLGASIVPMLLSAWFLIRNRRETLARKIAFLACVFVPLSVCLLSIGIYNYLRFGSLLEFGMHYTLQGLVSPKVYEFYNPKRFIYGLYYYLLCPPHWTRVFPFVVLDPYRAMVPPAFLVLEPVGGLLVNAPFIGILFALPAVVYSTVRARPLFAISLITSMLIGGALLVLFSLAAGTMRYEVDFATWFLLPALLLWLYLLASVRGRAWFYRSFLVIFLLLISYGMMCGLAFSMTGYADALRRYHPNAYTGIRSVFSPIESVLLPKVVRGADLKEPSDDVEGCFQDGWCGPMSKFRIRRDVDDRSLIFEGNVATSSKYTFPFDINIILDGVPADRFHVDRPGPFRHEVRLRSSGSSLWVGLTTAASFSGQDVGLNTDSRRLSFQLIEISVIH
jgi:hypothetical protein